MTDVIHEFGIIYVATKDGHEAAQALAAQESLKRNAPHVPATLMTTMPNLAAASEHDFDLVIPVTTEQGFQSSRAEARLDRWEALSRSPYEKTLLLDNGFHAASGDIAEMEQLLENNDLVLSPAASADRLPEALAGHLYETGMVGIRRSLAADALVEQVVVRLREQLT
ncbi:MAG: hypothetical protein HN577_01920, partial [Rhodospirillaceae bacterium]|nr:hypothetical protein [Rhodospirillaceae bacterium]